jgi:mevalonate kinase
MPRPVKNKLLRKLFYSKVLLFGEHVINKGGKGLAVPFTHYDGLFKLKGDLKDEEVKRSNQSLEKLAQYIIHHKMLGQHYDTNRLLDDIENGLYFDSNIPQGYGLGSSGALVAAVYFQYRLNKKKNASFSEIKNELAEVESFFHGKSSGLDPIVCYLNKAVLLDGTEVNDVFDLPESENPAIKIALINTHIERQTGPWVNLFLEKCKQPKFMHSIERALIPASNIAIENLVKKKYGQIMKPVKIISQLQLDLMPEFIPAAFKDAWQQGLKHNEYHLKICGAGGGGFIIAIANIDANLPLLLGGFDIIELMKL